MLVHRPLQPRSTRMPVTVGEISNEVIVESDQQLTGGAQPMIQPKQIATIRSELASIARIALRTRAEGFDD
jgi:hypothetical protein